MATMCDICHVRPATVRASVVRNGEQETLSLCEVDYRRLARQQRGASPLESLFGGRAGSLFDDFFDDGLWSDLPAGARRLHDHGDRQLTDDARALPRQGERRSRGHAAAGRHA